MNKMSVKLVGGPGHGRVIEADKGAEEVQFSFWRYSMTGKKEGKHHLFCVVPRSRSLRRMILGFIARFGYHPGLMAKQQPYRKPVKS